MFELLLVIYLTLFNLLFKVVVGIVVAVCKAVISVFFWLLRITIQGVLFIYRRLRRLLSRNRLTTTNRITP